MVDCSASADIENPFKVKEAAVPGIEWLVMVLMIALNSIFAGYEIALASIGLGTLHNLVKDRRTGANSALRMKTKMEASLAVVQLGITLVGVIAAATGGVGAEESIEHYSSREDFRRLLLR